MRFDRRTLLKTGALGALTFQVGGCAVQMTPREARDANVALQTLATEEARALDRLGEVLLPGVAQAGFTHFIDQQISGPPADMLATLRYVDWPPPYADFYQGGLAALDDESERRHAAAFADLPPTDAEALVRDISTGQPDDWSGPPAPLFYFIARSDAVDVFYGTMDGFDRLSVPYLAHIEPETPW